MLVHPTASPPLYISCMGFFNLFISYIVSTCAWTDYSGLIISHAHTCSSFCFCFVLIYHIQLDLSHFANDTNCRGFGGKRRLLGPAVAYVVCIWVHVHAHVNMWGSGMCVLTMEVYHGPFVSAQCTFEIASGCAGCFTMFWTISSNKSQLKLLVSVSQAEWQTAYPPKSWRRRCRRGEGQRDRTPKMNSTPGPNPQKRARRRAEKHQIDPPRMVVVRYSVFGEMACSIYFIQTHINNNTVWLSAS